MQNRYTGDIGDFAKYGLLRALGAGLRIGIAWYLFPDEPHNSDGGHVEYLEDPAKWRDMDPELYDRLRAIVQSDRRDVQQIEESGLFHDALFSSVPLAFRGDAKSRAKQRADWFRDVLIKLADCNVVFADPDNGLCEDRQFSTSDKAAWKRIPLSEAHVLAAGRTGVIYHHNTRRRGGHRSEIEHWLKLLGPDATALYWRRYSNRTFFVVHPTREIERRLREFGKKWAPHCKLHTLGESAR
ncbi:MAG: hypothetical protein A3I02_05320 [Betaproteobacteria bacterium RIFCSPLOWO2_02_FULL_67_26]|nr:MAG: hypothetical protein A3I02_05320 [Betaproteobacteria bacterium RIFCSPLOWO2_02_FULL_67_26]